ncbi:MAG: DUF58 domain-containing protein [Elusimicrobia bacterium]|nr:DUF58 domain-containing protein [Elusimicrobiota bacterium]
MFAKTRRIEIRTSRLVNELFAGRYHSTFKGRGVEFVDVREYVPGDDIRTIHWPVTARLGLPYIKRFREERELTILIAVDVSRSHAFGTRSRHKSELAAELVALLSFAALKNNDKVGLLLFSDRIESYLPPRKSRKHALRLVRDALTIQPAGHGTDIKGALEYLNRVQKRRAIVFLISDFLDEGWERLLAITQRHHDTVAFVVDDPMERKWPEVGRLVIEDAETGRRGLAPASGTFRTLFEKANAARREARNRIFSRHRLDRVLFRTDQDYVRPLLSFFQERARRIR